MCHSDIQRDVLGDDRGLEPPKIRPWIDPQLVGQQRPCPLISAKGFTLPAGAVEGEHQLAPSPLAQRRVGHRGLELADDLGGATRREQRIGPVLHQRGMALDPARLLGCSAPAIGQFGDSAPEGQRLLEAGHRLAGVAGGGGVTAHPGGQLVTRGINLGPGEGPARSLRHHDAVAEGAAQRGDVGLQGLGGGARRIIAPEQLDQRVGRDNRAAVQPEHREDGARFGARDRDGRTVLPDLERSQNPQFHRWKRTHVDHRRWDDSTRGQDRVKPPYLRPKRPYSETVIATVVVTILLALLFAFSSSIKLLSAPQSLAIRDHLGVSPTLWRVIGILELAGVIGVLVGLAWAPIGIAAAIGLALLSVGAVAFHLRARDGVVKTAPAVIGILLAAATAVLQAFAILTR